MVRVLCHGRQVQDSCDSYHAIYNKNIATLLEECKHLQAEQQQQVILIIPHITGNKYLKGTTKIIK